MYEAVDNWVLNKVVKKGKNSYISMLKNKNTHLLESNLFLLHTLSMFVGKKNRCLFF